MKIECIKEKLKNGVALAEKITGKNLTLPVLSTILLTAKGTTLKLRATNLDIGIEITIPAKVEEDGITAIPGTILNNFFSNLYADSIIMESDNENIRITTKNSTALVKTFPHDDFPTLPKIEKGKAFSIKIQKFIEGLKSVWYSASLSDIKPEISSVYIYIDEGEVVFAATDSFRLAEKKINLKTQEKVSSLLLPIKNISEIIRVFDGAEGDATVTFDKNQISFHYEGIYIASRIIDGVFPDYKQILPKEHTTEAVLLKQDLLNSLKITNLFSDKFNQITIKISPPKKTFEISSKNFDVGESVTKIDAALSGDPVVLNFNHKYILDCFQSIGKDSISLRFSGESKPMVIQPIGDRTFTYLVMPLNQ